MIHFLKSNIPFGLNRFGLGTITRAFHLFSLCIYSEITLHPFHVRKILNYFLSFSEEIYSLSLKRDISSSKNVTDLFVKHVQVSGVKRNCISHELYLALDEISAKEKAS